MTYPQRGRVYTTAELYKLELDDAPALICIDRSGVQNAHLSDEELLSVPGFAALRWAYAYRTSEWIPVFYLCPGQDEALRACVDVEPWVDSVTGQVVPGAWNVTPRGYPREQYVCEWS